MEEKTISKDTPKGQAAFLLTMLATLAFGILIAPCVILAGVGIWENLA